MMHILILLHLNRGTSSDIKFDGYKKAVHPKVKTL